MVKQISDNEMYLLIKYIKSVLWRVAKCLSYIEEARCLKVKLMYILCQRGRTMSCICIIFYFSNFRPLNFFQSDHNRCCCISTIDLLMMSTTLLETCRGL